MCCWHSSLMVQNRLLCVGVIASRPEMAVVTLQQWVYCWSHLHIMALPHVRNSAVRKGSAYGWAFMRTHARIVLLYGMC